ncbi:uncharacterized protein LOC128393995 [Panonychus citri]|uniref:uncharacterized protein LOC128393995 n=1 Tax=Panonychus citri TaxID=50023 RepID=UPI002306E69F|nr:uncharacterized protein LOC128393995 [Panonychus citri]
MNVNDLYDICLMTIFDKFDELEDLIIISQVCSKWRRLAQIRCEKITGLTFSPRNKVYILPKPQNIYTKSYKFMENINVAEVFPNLKLLETHSFGPICLCRVVANVLSTGNPLRGLFVEFERVSTYEIYKGKAQHHVDLDQEIVKHCGNLTRLLVNDPKFLDLFFNKYKFGEKLKMFGGFCGSKIGTFITYANRMPNLKKLYLQDKEVTENFQFPSFGYKFPGVEELTLASGSNYLFYSRWSSRFPDLRDLHIAYIDYDSGKFGSLAESIPKSNYNVRKVFLNFTDYTILERSQARHVMKEITFRYPNCTSLTIFAFTNFVTIEDTIEIIKAMPNLSSLYLPLITTNNQESDIIKIIDDFCRKENRNLVFRIVHQGSGGYRPA